MVKHSTLTTAHSSHTGHNFLTFLSCFYCFCKGPWVQGIILWKNHRPLYCSNKAPETFTHDRNQNGYLTSPSRLPVKTGIASKNSEISAWDPVFKLKLQPGMMACTCNSSSEFICRSILHNQVWQENRSGSSWDASSSTLSHTLQLLFPICRPSLSVCLSHIQWCRPKSVGWGGWGRKISWKIEANLGHKPSTRTARHVA